MAKAWFSNVRKRKLLLSCSENKLLAAVILITKKFPNERIMVFSETIDSINKLRDMLELYGIKFKVIDSNTSSSKRQKILDQ
jgi:SNF2 family DNA or RNA helicase